MNKYLSSGVNIEKGNKLVESLKPLSQLTFRPGALGNIGAFSGLFDLTLLKDKYQEPVLVSSTDGVGTKLCIAHSIDYHDTIGIDLVAMCVNDLLCQGAEPLFFLDYLATGHLDLSIATKVLQGIAKGCQEANVTLVGGETAEMPSMYSQGIYDLAGFTVGIVEKKNILPKTNQICENDIILGLSSNGIHSNGFSLVRKVMEDLKINYKDISVWNNKSWGEILLEPTLIYVKYLLPVMHLIKGMAHITGGGIIENIPRMILDNQYCAQIDLKSWTFPEIFQWLAREGKIELKEMLTVFNCGIGMAIIISHDKYTELINHFTHTDIKVYKIGKIIKKSTNIKDKVIINFS